ncbi:MAG: hypothetical protein WC005_05460 [Candidatus Nanopelagicales bacterium]
MAVAVREVRAYSSAPADAAGTLVDLSDPEVRRRLAPAAVTGVLAIASQWQITDKDLVALLGESISIPTLRRWRKTPPASMSVDQLERCSLLAGIHLALNIILSSENANRWVKTPNSGPLYGDRPPLEFMIHGRMAALQATRRHLDGVRGGQ